MIPIRRKKTNATESNDQLLSSLDLQVRLPQDFNESQSQSTTAVVSKKWTGAVNHESKSFTMWKIRKFPHNLLPCFIINGKLNKDNSEVEISLTPSMLTSICYLAWYLGAIFLIVSEVYNDNPSLSFLA